MKYVWDEELNLFRRTHVEAFTYSDGAEVEQRLFDIIRNASDRSTFSPELVKGITDWPSEYHLSRARHCLVRPLGIKPGEKVLELGCGCGAITRYLGEIGAEVIAVEGSIARARIAAERCRDLSNVKVFVDDLLRFETDERFDWILLVGVLEYAPVFSDEKEPAQHYLRTVARFLAPNGKLVIAIENKLGLKYFNGCSEDHLGIPFYGVQNLYGAKTPRTFGRRELLEQLSAAGFLHCYFYYPFPDYKLPSVVLSDDALKDPQFDAVDLIIRSHARDYSGSPYRLFDEALVFSTLSANGLFAEFSNSFLVVATLPNAIPYRADRLAMTFAVNRIPEFSVITSFYRSDDVIHVVKESVLQDLPRNHQFQEGFNILNVPSVAIYHPGRQLLWRLLSVRANKGTLDQVVAELRPWIIYLFQFAVNDGSHESFAIGADEWHNLRNWFVPGIYLDCTPFNLLETRQGLVFIDNEWQANCDVPLGWIITRGVLHSLTIGLATGNSIKSVADVVQRLCRSVALSTTEAEVASWIDMEARFLSFVTGQALSDISISLGHSASSLICLNQVLAEREGNIASLNQAVVERDVQIALLNQAIAERDEQITSLTQAVAERDVQIANLNQAVAERDGQIAELRATVDGQQKALAERDVQIADFTRAVAERDEQIASLTQAVAERDVQIANLNQAVAERDGQIVSFTQAVAERDGQIASLNQVVAERDGQITCLNQAVAERDEQIAAILSSRSWRITKLLRFLSRVMRGEWAMILAGLRAHIQHWGRWNKRITNASMRHLARLLVSTYSSSALIRHCFAAIKTISNKLVRPWLPALHDRVFVDFKLYLKQQWLNGSGGSDNATPMGLYSLPKPIQEKFYPKVSVIVPNYNHARYLRQRLESIYRQTYQNIEVILLDDASSDESTQILDEYRQRYPNITRCYFNNKNSGGVFYQWKRGIELAQGELIWIAESDDYCSDNLLEELVKFFANEAVMLAFCRTVFVDGDTSQQIWSLEEYLADLVDPALWRQPFIKSAHQLVNTAWAVKNIIPNVSSAVFRNPGKLELLEKENWKLMRICGDWIFYLHIIRGGLVAYTPNATNFYRMHKKNTSVDTYKQDIYYREHEKVAEELLKLYRLQEGILEKQRYVLESHWRLSRTDYSVSYFKKCYDYERIRHLSKSRKPNLFMITFALIAGGGETFPIRLANLLKSAGYGVTLLNCHREPTEPGVRKMLRRDIPLLELDRFDKLNAVVDDMGIEIVHSHHAWVDVTICTLLEDNPNCKVVVTTHGMYEMMSHADLARVVPLLNKRVNKFVYIADKNLGAFDFSVIDKNRFTKIGNALDIVPITPVPREELGINEEDFVLCLVSRAIPEKGWEEGIEAVKLARKLSGKEIHLLLIGEGPEYKRLRRKVRDHFIHFLGFRANVRDYFATSDLGFLPSRFPGESYPLVVIECLQSNRPMLASNIGEIASMLETESGLAGSVFSLDNWRIPIKRAAEIIAEYAMNRDLYSEHLKRVPEAAKKFDTEKLLHSYEVVYQEIIGDIVLNTDSDDAII